MFISFLFVRKFIEQRIHLAAFRHIPVFNCYYSYLPKPTRKSHPEEKWAGHGLGELPKILGFPFNISAMAEASDFKFGMQLGFAKAHHKITPRGKMGLALALLCWRIKYDDDDDEVCLSSAAICPN